MQQLRMSETGGENAEPTSTAAISIQKVTPVAFAARALLGLALAVQGAWHRFRHLDRLRQGILMGLAIIAIVILAATILYCF